MRNSVCGRIYSCLQYSGLRKACSSSSLFSRIQYLPSSTSPKPDFHGILGGFKTRCNSPKLTPYFTSIAAFRQLHTPSVTDGAGQESGDDDTDDSSGEEEPVVTWEDEEDEAEPEIGDGGDGGGIVLENCAWGQRALSIAREVLQEFGEEIELYAFKASPRGHVYVRLDKLSHEYGCPSVEEIASFHLEYRRKLDEVGASGQLPDNIAIDVSSPSAERLLRVPDDALRFKDKPMVVTYSEDTDGRGQEKTGVYLLDSIETESECCVWKLADVKENRDPLVKGKPLNRKQKEARVKIPFAMIKLVKFYTSY